MVCIDGPGSRTGRGPERGRGWGVALSGYTISLRPHAGKQVRECKELLCLPTYVCTYVPTMCTYLMLMYCSQPSSYTRGRVLEYPKNT